MYRCVLESATPIEEQAKAACSMEDQKHPYLSGWKFASRKRYELAFLSAMGQKFGSIGMPKASPYKTPRPLLN
jgi:hypothetical protein